MPFSPFPVPKKTSEPQKKTTPISKKETGSSKSSTKTPAKKSLTSKKVSPSVKKKTVKKSEKKVAVEKKNKDIPKVEVKKTEETIPKKNTSPKTSPKSQTSPTHIQEEADLAEEILGVATEPMEKADIYDELMAQEMEKELIRSQRKQMAGKDAGKKAVKKVEPQAQSLPAANRIIEIPEVISVKEFSEKTGLGAAKVIGELMKNGVLANINQMIDFDTAQIIAADLRINIKKKRTEATAEDVFLGDLSALLKNEDTDDLESRPPIVVVMGHVDHGKTKLLDAIRETDVVAGEAGGITQHIGAYQVEKNGKRITFLDTPGHEAFTAMRARGAKVTDIAILVVAADEGVKPQTVEALHHAQDAGVPIIVAINKIDKENAQPDRVKGELGEYGLVPEEWGGKTIMVPVSALTGAGIPQLLEMILLVADLENLRANPNREAIGTVIESHLNQSLGPIATVIINSGTLRIMDNVVVGSTYGRIKVMKDYLGKSMKTAPPSTPVLIAGLAETPQSGDILHAVPEEQSARDQAMKVRTMKEAHLLEKRGVGEIISQITSGKLKQLKLVLKADTKGSLEALKQSIAQIKNDDVGVKIILSGVGAITESDVLMAAAGGGIVMGFHVEANLNVKRLAEREHIEVLTYKIIYQLLDDIKKILTGLLEPEMVENILGKAEVRKIFLTEKKEMIVGCKVITGHVENKVKVRVFRHEQLVGEGQIVSLKHVDKVVNEVTDGNECGIRYGGFLPLLEGDLLEAYKIEKRIRTL